MTRKLPIYKIVPMECDFLEIAVVDNPAIEEYFLMFNEEPIKIEFNSDKQIIKGPVMVPDKLIYRNDRLGERFVTYDSAGIQLAAEMFLKNGFKFNKDHTSELLPIQIIESYFAQEPNEFGVSKGSWIVSAKVNDSELWSQFKNNERGFSFQSLFSNELIGTEELNFNTNKNKEMDLKEKLMTAINTVLFAEVPEVVETPVVEEVPVVTEEVVVEEFAEAPVTPEVPVVEEETVQLTPEMVQQMIDASLVIAVEAVISQVKEMLGQGDAKVEVEMSAMKAKIEEFGAQPLSKPITETVVNTVKLTGDYAYLSGINK